jgi:hypothetical protein
MDICTCLKYTKDLIFSPLAVKRNVIGVSMKISIDRIVCFEFGVGSERSKNGC